MGAVQSCCKAGGFETFTDIDIDAGKHAELGASGIIEAGSLTDMHIDPFIGFEILTINQSALKHLLVLRRVV